MNTVASLVARFNVTPAEARVMLAALKTARANGLAFVEFRIQGDLVPVRTGPAPKVAKVVNFGGGRLTKLA
jgi:hypothetical protein